RISPRERRKVFPLPQPLQEGVRLGSCSLSRLLRGVRHDHDLPERQEPRTLLQLRARVLEARAHLVLRDVDRAGVAKLGLQVHLLDLLLPRLGREYVPVFRQRQTLRLERLLEGRAAPEARYQLVDAPGDLTLDANRVR